MAGSSPVAVDKNTLKRMQNIQQLEQNDRQTITSVIDAFIRDAKARKAYGKNKVFTLTFIRYYYFIIKRHLL